MIMQPPPSVQWESGHHPVYNEKPATNQWTKRIQPPTYIRWEINHQPLYNEYSRTDLVSNWPGSNWPGSNWPGVELTWSNWPDVELTWSNWPGRTDLARTDLVSNSPGWTDLVELTWCQTDLVELTWSNWPGRTDLVLSWHGRACLDLTHGVVFNHHYIHALYRVDKKRKPHWFSNN